MAEYDPENIFAKIIDAKVPCFKVFENRTSLAYLDAFPMVEGHTLVIPKVKGCTSLLTMKPRDAAAFMGDVQRVAKAVQEATGATAINIWQNCGADAGQTVFHPHIHIVPRKEGDNLITYPASAKEMLSKDAADPLVAKVTAALNPPKPLKKAVFGQVKKINPGSKGLNLKVKLVEEVKEVEGGKGQTFHEVLAGDDSGTVVLSLTDEQALGFPGGLSKGKTLVIQNGAVKMKKGHVRVAVDKWGKIEEAGEAFEGDVNMDTNVSATEFELVGN